jgi:uncharacterized protein (TIGR02300 family)
VAKAELGTKRIDPETGKKFYDLNRDPIVSPYTGISYPRSYFDSTLESRVVEEETEEEELDTALEKPEFVSLEDADDETKGSGDDLPDIDDDDVDLAMTMMTPSWKKRKTRTTICRAFSAVASAATTKKADPFSRSGYCVFARRPSGRLVSFGRVSHGRPPRSVNYFWQMWKELRFSS